MVIDIEAGEKITAAHIKSIRPGNGLHTRFYDVVIGKTIKQSAIAGTPINFNMFE